MKRKAISMLLVVAMLVAVVTPAFATALNDAPLEDIWCKDDCCEVAFGDALVIEVNSIEELIAVHQEHGFSEIPVIIMLGLEICPEEANLALENLELGDERGVVIKGLLLLTRIAGRLYNVARINRIGTSELIVMYRNISGARNALVRLFNAGHRGSVIWANPCGCGRCGRDGV